jgi:hypothetical protein
MAIVEAAVAIHKHGFEEQRSSQSYFCLKILSLRLPVAYVPTHVLINSDPALAIGRRKESNLRDSLGVWFVVGDIQYM